MLKQTKLLDSFQIELECGNACFEDKKNSNVCMESDQETFPWTLTKRALCLDMCPCPRTRDVNGALVGVGDCF